MYKLTFLALICHFLSMTLPAQDQKLKVLLLGSFHFDNPGLDVARFDNANIMTAKRQKEVLAVVDLLRKFRPDKIFVEQPTSKQNALDSSFGKYMDNGALRSNEIHQLGFRLAKELGLKKLYAVDYREADFPFDSLIKSASAAQQFFLLSYVKKSIDSIELDFNNALKSKTVKELLLSQNSKASADFQVGSYFDFLVTGKEGDHVGSYLTSEWWRRNMIIYENILKRLDGKEKNILVIFGAGHTALLRLMMNYNRNIELVSVESVLN